MEEAGGRADLTAELVAEEYCYLTTTGRRSGRDHTVEIWFAAEGRTIYLISGGQDRSDWVRNLLADPAATVTVGAASFRVRARVPVIEPADEREQAVRLVHAKYSRSQSSLDSWLRDAYIVALDVVGPADSH